MYAIVASREVVPAQLSQGVRPKALEVMHIWKSVSQLITHAAHHKLRMVEMLLSGTRESIELWIHSGKPANDNQDEPLTLCWIVSQKPAQPNAHALGIIESMDALISRANKSRLSVLARILTDTKFDLTMCIANGGHYAGIPQSIVRKAIRRRPTYNSLPSLSPGWTRFISIAGSNDNYSKHLYLQFILGWGLLLAASWIYLC